MTFCYWAMAINLLMQEGVLQQKQRAISMK
jgi:hypothetical protein